MCRRLISITSIALLVGLVSAGTATAELVGLWRWTVRDGSPGAVWAQHGLEYLARLSVQRVFGLGSSWLKRQQGQIRHRPREPFQRTYPSSSVGVSRYVPKFKCARRYVSPC